MGTKLISLCVLLVLGSVSFAQLQGEVKYDNLGVKFHIPEPWVGEQSDEMIIVNHPFLNNTIVVSLNTNTLDELKVEAREGLSNGQGTHLELVSTLEYPKPNYLAGYYKGIVEWQTCEAYIIGRAKEESFGVSVINLAFAGAPLDSVKDVGMQIIESFEFYKPVTNNQPETRTKAPVSNEPSVQDWIRRFQNVRLTYMNSYSSGGGGGYSSEEVIDLCAAGYFNFNGSNSMSVGTPGSSVYQADNKNGAGNWNVMMEKGQPVLVLLYHNGRAAEYYLELRDGKLFMNDYRYFMTYDGELAPDCR